MVSPARDPQTLKRRLGGYVRRGNIEAAEATRRDLKEAALEAAVERAVAKFGPLGEEQRAKLAILLQPSDLGEVA